MKKIITNMLKAFVIVLMVSIAYTVEAQAPDGPPPPPGGAGGGTNESGNSQGSQAPIGGGLFILLGLGAAYGGRKVYQIKKEGLEE